MAIDLGGVDDSRVHLIYAQTTSLPHCAISINGMSVATFRGGVGEAPLVSRKGLENYR